jgi:hypothetical protein
MSPQSSARSMLHDYFLLRVLFHPEDGGDMFLRNVDLSRRNIWPYTLEDTCQNIVSKKLWFDT